MHKITIANGHDLITGGKVVLPENAVYVGREVKRYGLKASPLKNIYPIGRMSREQCVDAYATRLSMSLRETRGRFTDTDAMQEEIPRLRALAERGPLTLVCWCAPKRCHAEVIRELLLGPCPFIPPGDHHPHCLLDKTVHCDSRCDRWHTCTVYRGAHQVGEVR